MRPWGLSQLRDICLELCTNPTSDTPFADVLNSAGEPSQDPSTRVIDVYSAASRVTYDIIGQIAIDHVFDALGRPHGPGGELFEKYERMQQLVGGSEGIRQDLSSIYPPLDKLWVSALSANRGS